MYMSAHHMYMYSTCVCASGSSRPSDLVRITTSVSAIESADESDEVQEEL